MLEQTHCAMTDASRRCLSRASVHSLNLLHALAQLGGLLESFFVFLSVSSEVAIDVSKKILFVGGSEPPRQARSRGGGKIHKNPKMMQKLQKMAGKRGARSVPPLLMRPCFVLFASFLDFRCKN